MLPMSMSFDPTRPPPIFFQQPLPSSLSAPQPQLNLDNNRQILNQVCKAECMCFFYKFGFLFLAD